MASYPYLRNQNKVEDTFVVTPTTLTQSVKVTGQVQASRDANLSFQTIGAVRYVGVKIGDTVAQGKTLATLEAGDAQAALLQSQAALESAQATLEQLTQGARPEELAVKQQAADNAKSTLDQAYAALPDAIQNINATAGDVVKNKLSPLFSTYGDHYSLSFSSCDQALQSDVELSRTKLENTLADFQKNSLLISAISDKGVADTTFEKGYQATLLTNELVNRVSTLLLSSCSIANPSLDSYRTALTAVHTSMTTLFADITAKRNALTSAKNAYSQALKDLELTKAGTDPYKLKMQRALVAQAEAQVSQSKTNLSKTVIIAPFSGTISEVTLSPGETVTQGKPVISMLAVDSFEIEAKIPEIDIVKIVLGRNVNVTLDAYGTGVVFPATVTRINPTATTEGTVPVYKIVITFVGKDARIKSGMTANVTVLTQNKSGVYAVPARFITVLDEAHGKASVMVNKKEVVKPVALGIRGDDGLIEVVSGLTEGDILVPPTTASRQAQKQTQ
jgi:HlyD family secretion protein